MDSQTNPNINASSASMRRTIQKTWKQEAKAAVRLDMLERMVSRGEALKDAVRVGRRITNQKQVPNKEEYDQTTYFISW